MKLYVIMGNDYPAGVMDNETAADALCQSRMDEQKKGLKPYEMPRIFWRAYAFDLNELEP